MLNDALPIFLFAMIALTVAAALPAIVRLIAGARKSPDDAPSTNGLLDQHDQPRTLANDSLTRIESHSLQREPATTADFSSDREHVRFVVELIVLQVLAVFLFLWAAAADVGSDNAIGSTARSDGTAFWTLVVLTTLPIVGIGYARLNEFARGRVTRIEPESRS